jgi:hypothetical protein
MARDDAAAYVNAEGLGFPHGYELWSGIRLVMVVHRPDQPITHVARALKGV